MTLPFPVVYPRESFVAQILGLIECDATCENVSYCGEEMDSEPSHDAD